MLLHFKKVTLFYTAAQYCEKSMDAGEDLICEGFSLKLCIAMNITALDCQAYLRGD